MKTKRLIFGIAGIAAIVLCCYFLLGSSSKKNLNWITEKVNRNSISNMVTATGTVEPITQVEVGTQVSGIIRKIYVDYNSVVTKGELIAELDKTTLESDLRSKESDLASSRTEYEYQQKNYARSKVLYEKKLISDTDYETATYQYEKAKSAYEKNQADLVKVKTNLSYATIYSPIDGVVLSRAVEEGQTVAASFSTPTLFTIANDLTKMQVIANVDEADIGQVEVGQRVTFTVDAYPNDVFSGDVTQVRLEATTTSNVVTYEVVVNAPNPDLKLKPGLTANITIYTREDDNVLTVSSKALRFVPDQTLAGDGTTLVADKNEQRDATHKSVWVKEGNVLREVPVIVGITSGSIAEITEGLKEGEEVVVEMSADKVAAMTAQEEKSSEGRSPFMPQPRKKK